MLAAGGLADGAGLVAALALGADGILLGDAVLMATDQLALTTFDKEGIVAADGEDTIVTPFTDTLSGRNWPGAWSRGPRNRFVEEWLGREPELRRRRKQVREPAAAAEEQSDHDYWLMWFGQSGRARRRRRPAVDVVREIVAEAGARRP